MTRKVGRPLRVREVLAGAFLFELAFGLWIGLYLILEARTSSRMEERELVVGWFYFALWIMVGVSSVIALIGVVLADSLRTAEGRTHRVPVALLAGTIFGLGWLIVNVAGAVISKAIGNSDAVGMGLFWSYLLLGPLFAFGGSAVFLGKVLRRDPGAAA